GSRRIRARADRRPGEHRRCRAPSGPGPGTFDANTTTGGAEAPRVHGGGGVTAIHVSEEISETVPEESNEPAPTVAGIRAAVAPILERIGATAHGREDTRDYAFDEVRELAARRIGLIGIARSEGGAG